MGICHCANVKPFTWFRYQNAHMHIIGYTKIANASRKVNLKVAKLESYGPNIELKCLGLSG